MEIGELSGCCFVQINFGEEVLTKTLLKILRNTLFFNYLVVRKTD